jgi:molybdenum cofactor cytidylyltransferase
MLVAVLAAGKAMRFGAPKLSQPCAGKPLGRWALDVAIDTKAPVIVVAATAADWMHGPGCEVVLNHSATSGMASSVRLAAECAQRRNADTLLLLLADMPLVGPALVDELVQGDIPAACLYPDRHVGVPAALPASLFPKILKLAGDRGAGYVLQGLDGLRIVSTPPSALLDVDTPEDLERAARICGGMPRL